MPSPPDQDPQLYARSFADVYDEWYSDLDDPDLVVDAFARRLEAGATILELGSGTGRLASPLAQAGFCVLALDASVPMLRQDRTGANRVAGDMAHVPLRTGCAAGALIAYNTFFNLPSRHAQLRCLMAIGQLLQPDGLLAVDVFSAAEGKSGNFGITVRDHPTRPAERLAIITGPGTDPSTVIGSHIELGDVTTCRPWQITYCNPGELDLLAHSAGLELVTRHRDWVGEPFGEDSMRHVSWYRRLDADSVPTM